MKKIINHFQYHFKVLLMILLFLLLSSCSGVTPSGPTISSFTSNSTSIIEGENVTLSWVTNATSVSIDHGIGTVAAPSGSTTVTPASTTTYTLTATNSAGSSTAVVTVTVSSGSTYVITATSGAGGQIEPAGAIVVNEGGSLAFSITPVTGYKILNVLVDEVSVGAVNSYTFTSIQQDHIIHAEFSPVYSWLPFVPVINMDDIWAILILLGKRIYNNDTGISYDYIQEAIDDAKSGHTIIVSSGTYFENIEFDNKNITLQSTDPLDPTIVATTIIDGGGKGSVVHFLNGDVSTLAGFTIQNGDARNGGGIFIGNYCAPTIANNTIISNKAEFGGGIGAARSAATITGNIITSNHATNYFARGGGIYVFKCLSALIINGNTIKDNAASEGGGIYVDNYSTPTVTNNTVTDNTAVQYGGGIYVDSTCKLLPSTDRPIGWGTGIEAKKNIPPQYWSTVAGNSFSGNSHGGDPNNGAHVNFK